MIKKIKNFLLFKFDQIFYNIDFTRKIIAFFHYLYFSKYIKENNSYIIVYDCKCSASTYGDFTFTILLARYFEQYKKKVTIYILNDEYRSSWSRYSDKNKIKVIKDFSKFAKYYLDKKYTNLKITSFSNFKKENLKENKSIFFSNRVYRRYKMYNCIFNILQYAHIFNNKKFKNFLLPIKKKTHVAVHARYSGKGKLYTSEISTDRNMSINDLAKIIKKIRNRYKNNKIVILTDMTGYNHYKSLKHKFTKLIFSKEISKDYIGDVELLLSSIKYYHYNGGGICVFAWFSKLPYLCCWKGKHYVNNEMFWKNYYKYTSWQFKDQKTFFCKSIDDFVSHI